MKKLTLLVSALTAGVFANAQADISVSGSSVIAYQSVVSTRSLLQQVVFQLLLVET